MAKFTSLGKALGDDLEAGLLKIKLERGLKNLYSDHPTRKRELHVSDFTASETTFCPRRLIARYIKGDVRAKDPTWIHYDGKWRENKWKDLFEATKIMLDYQTSLRVDRLVGHPDFVVDFGKGPRIVELTGRDPRVPIGMFMGRLAVKKRQCLMYMSMYRQISGDPMPKGFVIVEDKASSQYKIHVVDWDEEKAAVMMDRVKQVSDLINQLVKAPQERRKDIYLSIPKCGSSRCSTCR